MSIANLDSFNVKSWLNINVNNLTVFQPKDLELGAVSTTWTGSVSVDGDAGFIQFTADIPSIPPGGFIGTTVNNNNINSTDIIFLSNLLVGDTGNDIITIGLQSVSDGSFSVYFTNTDTTVVDNYEPDGLTFYYWAVRSFV